LRSRIYNDWVSNDNWAVIALSYRLDRLVGWCPKTSFHVDENPQGKKEKNKVDTKGEAKRKAKRKAKGGAMSGGSNADKFWADLWEGYWAGILNDRELWNEEQHVIEDLHHITQYLMSLRYSRIIDLYSTNYILVPYYETTTTTPAAYICRDSSGGPPNPAGAVKRSAKCEDVRIRVIKGDDKDIAESLGQAEEEENFGYVATIDMDATKSAMSTFTSNPSDHDILPPETPVATGSISVYATIPEAAISKALYCARMGLKRTSPLPNLVLVLTSVAHRLELPPKLFPPLGTTSSTRSNRQDDVANSVRQMVFDIMVKNWIPASSGTGVGFSIPIPLSKEAILPVYKEIRDLGRRLLDEPMDSPENTKDTLQSGSGFITHMKEFAMLFWYEV
jgi:hypothetical protein